MYNTALLWMDVPCIEEQDKTLELTPDILTLVLGDAGVWGLEGGVIGLENRILASCRREAGDPMEGGWEMLNTSIESISIGEGGLSSSVADIRWVWRPVIESSTYMFRNAYNRNKYVGDSICFELLKKHLIFLNMCKRYRMR